MKRRTFIATLLSLPFFRWLRPAPEICLFQTSYELNIVEALREAGCMESGEAFTADNLRALHKKMMDCKIPPFEDETGSYYVWNLPGDKWIRGYINA